MLRKVVHWNNFTYRWYNYNVTIVHLAQSNSSSPCVICTEAFQNWICIHFNSCYLGYMSHMNIIAYVQVPLYWNWWYAAQILFSTFSDIGEFNASHWLFFSYIPPKCCALKGSWLMHIPPCYTQHTHSLVLNYDFWLKSQFRQVLSTMNM